MHNSKNQNIIIKIIATTCALVLVSSCARTTLHVINKLAKNKGYTAKLDLAYGTHPLNKLDIYMPSKSTDHLQSKPVLIFFYGGCWGACQTYTKKSYTFVGQALSNKGYVTVLVNYRHYPQVRFNTIISDAAKSVEWVKKNIHRFGGNSKNIFLMGHSAGGHLAATLAYDRRYLKANTWKNIRGMIGLAAPYDFYPFDHDYQSPQWLLQTT